MDDSVINVCFSAESMFEIDHHRWPWYCNRSAGFCYFQLSNVTVKSLKLHVFTYTLQKFSNCRNLTWPPDLLFLVTVPKGKVA